MLLTAALFEELQDIGKIPARGPSSLAKQGTMIRDTLRRNLPFERLDVYLWDAQRTSLRHVAGEVGAVVPPSLEKGDVVSGQPPAGFDPPADIVLPLTSSKDLLGAIALGGGRELPLSETDCASLRAIAAYLSAFLATSRMAGEIREGDFQLRYHLWELESLYDIGLSIASMLDLGQLGDEILMRTVSLVNARRAALYLRQGDRFALHQTLGGARAQFLDEEITDDAAKQLLVEGKPLHFEGGANCIFPDCETLVAMPIRSSDNEVIGVLAAADREYRDGSVGGFDEGEIRLLSRFANQVSIALQNARLHREALEKQAMDRDLELAGSIQSNILPRMLPKTEGYEIAVLHNPARQLGGDYHVFFEHDDIVSTCVADVAGKSVPAAILVSAFHAALQLLFHEGRELGEIAGELNRHIHRWSSDSKFITLVLATIDRKAQEIRYVNAGHNPVYVLRNGAVETLHSHGLPIGIMSGSKYETQTRPFLPGSLLALYSDGITEASNLDDDEFGSDRLQELLLANENRSCAEIRDEVRRAVVEFAGERPQYDDQTLVLVRTAEESKAVSSK